MNNLKFIDLFSGIGGFRSALEKNGHECRGFSEIDNYAIQSYKTLYDTKNEIELGDITKVSDEEFKSLKGEVDLVVGGSPCFRAGTLITTNKGLKPIEDIKKGDMVLTHRNRYKAVVMPMVTHAKSIYRLRVMNSNITHVTEEHPFLVVERLSKKGTKYIYSEPKWVKTKDLIKGKHFIKLGKDDTVNNDNDITEEEAWLIGRYIADGYLLDSKRPNRKNSYRRDVIYCVGKSKYKEFEKNLKDYSFSRAEERTVYKYRKQNARLFNLVSKCGRGAINKEIPREYINLPQPLLSKLIEGYISGDGSYDKTLELFSATTISPKLALSLVESFNKIHGNGTSVIFTKRPKKTFIEGREVNQKDTYRVQTRFNYNKGKSPQTIKINDELYAPIKELIKEDTDELVYNFEVQDDNSYVANNLVAHNCQSFSNTGLKRGFEDTRGTLFFDYARAVKHIQPKMFLYENVKGLISHDKMNTIKIVLETFDELGYYIDFHIFNSKFYDVPQNRERIYIVGKRKDLVSDPTPHDRARGRRRIVDVQNWARENISFVQLLPPLRDEVTMQLSDVLEDYVDEKYFLKGDYLERVRKQIVENERKPLRVGEPNRIAGIWNSPQAGSVFDVRGISRSLDTSMGGYREPIVLLEGEQINARKITPLEAWRLQGFTDEQFKRVKDVGMSDWQLYIQTGNAVTVNVVDYIVKHILK